MGVQADQLLEDRLVQRVPLGMLDPDEAVGARHQVDQHLGFVGLDGPVGDESDIHVPSVTHERSAVHRYEPGAAGGSVAGRFGAGDTATAGRGCRATGPRSARPSLEPGCCCVALVMDLGPTAQQREEACASDLQPQRLQGHRPAHVDGGGEEVFAGPGGPRAGPRTWCRRRGRGRGCGSRPGRGRPWRSA